MDIKIAKIGVLKDSDQAIDRMLLKVNDGFAGGRITKVDLVSWIILYFETQFMENIIEKIQKDHFDQVVYLESVIKGMKQARKVGTTQPDLISLLAPITSTLKGNQKRKTSTGVPEDKI